MDPKTLAILVSEAKMFFARVENRLELKKYAPSAAAVERKPVQKIEPKEKVEGAIGPQKVRDEFPPERCRDEYPVVNPGFIPDIVTANTPAPVMPAGEKSGVIDFEELCKQDESAAQELEQDQVDTATTPDIEKRQLFIRQNVATYIKETIRRAPPIGISTPAIVKKVMKRFAGGSDPIIGSIVRDLAKAGEIETVGKLRPKYYRLVKTENLVR